ncbi:hypothetical protein, partial [Streptomyces sp. SID161]|uniref:hypothetical protein n=1 Tax=Streptomyces sp. SID161 TaxID=2690251 RepID=UPI001F340375
GHGLQHAQRVLGRSGTRRSARSSRNRVVEEDATPLSFICTLFCATSMVICMRQPMPRRLRR